MSRHEAQHHIVHRACCVQHASKLSMSDAGERVRRIADIAGNCAYHRHPWRTLALPATRHEAAPRREHHAARVAFDEQRRRTHTKTAQPARDCVRAACEHIAAR